MKVNLRRQQTSLNEQDRARFDLISDLEGSFGRIQDQRGMVEWIGSFLSNGTGATDTSKYRGDMTLAEYAGSDGRYKVYLDKRYAELVWADVTTYAETTADTNPRTARLYADYSNTTTPYVEIVCMKEFTGTFSTTNESGTRVGVRLVLKEVA